MSKKKSLLSNFSVEWGDLDLGWSEMVKQREETAKIIEKAKKDKGWIPRKERENFYPK